MDCNIVGSAGGGDLAQLAAAPAVGGSAAQVDAVSERPALMRALRRLLEANEIPEHEMVEELGCALEEASCVRLAEWVGRLDWYLRRVALDHVSDAPGH